MSCQDFFLLPYVMMVVVGAAADAAAAARLFVSPWIRTNFMANWLLHALREHHQYLGGCTATSLTMFNEYILGRPARTITIFCARNF